MGILKPYLENPGADGVSDPLGVHPLLAGDDGEVGDDGLRVEDELRKDLLVELHDLAGRQGRRGFVVVLTAVPQLLLAVSEHGPEALEDGRGGPLRRRLHHGRPRGALRREAPGIFPERGEALVVHLG